MIGALEDTFAENDFDDFKIVVKARDSESAAWSYEWRRPVPRNEGAQVPSETWSLNLRLQVLKDEWDGSLELSRRDSSVLLLDVNLLTCELRAELERACQRAVLVEDDVQRRAAGSVLTIARTLDCAQKLG
jgi:hypothetical protein